MLLKNLDILLNLVTSANIIFRISSVANNSLIFLKTISRFILLCNKGTTIDKQSKKSVRFSAVKFLCLLHKITTSLVISKPNTNKL